VVDKDREYTANLSRLHDVRQVSLVRSDVHLALANEGESCFVVARTCRSQGTKGACMAKPICVRQGDRHPQPRHQAQKEREDWRPRKSFACVALDQGVYKD
jgi:hypothetical protein